MSTKSSGVAEVGEPTMDRIAAAAEARTQELLDCARRSLSEAERALGEAAGSPLFSNGVAKGLREAHQTVAKTDRDLQNLKVLVGKVFRGDDKAQGES